jgi:hypothetical protein
MPIPVTLNAWTGFEKVAGSIADPAGWALRRKLESAQRLLAPDKIDLQKWEDERVGWGVVIADGAKIPPPLQELIDKRKGNVFNYIANWDYQFILLRNRKAGKDIDINGAPRGTADDALPYYLLIYGSPTEVPWQIQYILNANRCVGRLDLTGKALENYINALLSGNWGPPHESANQGRALIWAVDLGDGDITSLMRNAIAFPLVEDLREDDQIGTGARFLDGAANPVEVAQLTDALASDHPGLIVTTSHGMTGPLGDNAEAKAAMRRDLGLPVDTIGKVLAPDALLSKWQPAGAIWYAHACCSAGADTKSSFADLVDSDSIAAKVLAGVASLGAQIAPLPTALLGAERPLRAFIGHVEPTFDWTLKQTATGQFLTASILEALYGQMYVKKGDIEKPIGHAFREWYGRTNGLRAQYDKARTQLDNGESTEGILLALQLAARDVESTVILGDPTVAMPGLE